jgi:hypothetical protein
MSTEREATNNETHGPAINIQSLLLQNSAQRLEGTLLHKMYGHPIYQRADSPTG